MDVDRESAGDGGDGGDLISQTGPRAVAEPEHRTDGCDSETGQAGESVEQRLLGHGSRRVKTGRYEIDAGLPQDTGRFPRGIAVD